MGLLSLLEDQEDSVVARRVGGKPASQRQHGGGMSVVAAGVHNAEDA